MNTTDDLKIAIIIGSTRPGRRADRVANWLHAIAAERTDATFDLVDLAHHDLPLYDEPVPALAGQYAGAHTKRWAATVGGYDGFVFVAPEYNHAAPAALKNAIDYLFAEWNDKAAGFVGYGASGGGVRAIEHLRLVLAELKVATVRAHVALAIADDWSDRADPTSFAPRDAHTARARALLDETVAWSRALRAVRIPGPATAG